MESFQKALVLPPDIALAARVAPVAEKEGGAEGGVGLLPGERALLSTRAAPKRVREFALGRRCAREALERLGLPGAAGLPILREGSRAPRWPEGVVGAITHAQVAGATWAVAAVGWRSAYRGIGMDLERARHASPRMVERIALPEEAAWLAGGGSPGAAGFALLFSAKESVFKALHPTTGVYLGYHDARVEFGPGEPAAGHPPAGSVEPACPPQIEGRGSFRWKLEVTCGAEFPRGFAGEGRYGIGDGWALTAVWVGS